jgi:VanZ family protein
LKRYTPLLLLALLIAYGSLYPFHYAAPASFNGAWTAFIDNRHLWTSVGDEVGNVALFIPLGGAAAVAVQPGRYRTIALVALFAGCVLLAVVTQILQIYFPPREASIADVLANAIGALIGMLAALVVQSMLTVRLPHLTKAAWIVLLLLLVWMAGDLWPFVPAIDFAGWKRSVKPLFIAPALSWTSVMFHAVAIYLVRELIASVLPQATVGRVVVLLAAGVLLGKLVIEDQSITPSFVLGTACGLMTMRTIGRLGAARMPALWALLFATFTMRSLLPLTLRAEPSPFGWIPFASLLNGDMDINARSLADSIYFFLGMSWLVARAHGRVMPVAVMLAVWAAAIEVAQRWLVSHSPDITQPILALVAGLVIRTASRAGANDALPDALAGGPATGRCRLTAATR